MSNEMNDWLKDHEEGEKLALSGDTKMLDYNIFFTSDTHFGHQNIIKYCDRPFDDFNHMNEILIKNWNEVVKPDNIVYFLGDFAFGNVKNYYRDLSERLNGEIILLKGNHDRGKELEKYFDLIDHMHPFTFAGYKFVLSHRPLPKNQIPVGYYNLHGHIHNNTLQFENTLTGVTYDLEKSINVSTDVTDFKPINIIDIINNIMK